jgi:hypothetical protein
MEPLLKHIPLMGLPTDWIHRVFQQWGMGLLGVATCLADKIQMGSNPIFSTKQFGGWVCLAWTPALQAEYSGVRIPDSPPNNLGEGKPVALAASL